MARPGDDLLAEKLGSRRAWVYAALYPETLDKLVILNAPHPTVFAKLLQSNTAQQKASSYMTFFQSANAEPALIGNNYALLSSMVFSTNRPDAFTQDDKNLYLEAWKQPGAITAGLNYYRASNLAPPSKQDADTKSPAFKAPSLPVIKVPTLVLWGEKDTALLTSNLIGLDKVVKTLTIKRVPSAGHWIVHEQPELVNKTIREFLEGD